MKSVKFLAFNRRVLNAALASAVVLAGTGVVSGAYAATGTGAATATVVTPISFTNPVTLSFGKFTNVANTITVTPAAGRTATAANSLLTGSPGVAGELVVSGESGATYSISLTGGNLTKVASTETMVLGSLTAAASTATGTTITAGTLTGGTQTLKIGGALTVGAAQVAGVYNGTYAVTLEYN